MEAGHRVKECADRVIDVLVHMVRSLDVLHQVDAIAREGVVNALQQVQRLALIVHGIDEALVQALKHRAAKHGRSAEAEHRALLEQALLKPRRKTFAQALRSMPNVGLDTDFERVDDEGTRRVFD